jgi:hypothetical protein
VLFFAVLSFASSPHLRPSKGAGGATDSLRDLWFDNQAQDWHVTVGMVGHAGCSQPLFTLFTWGGMPTPPRKALVEFR